MAAGLGFKTFASGDVLSAGDVNGYLMQGVLVFASAAARDAAITSPQEGQFAYTKDTNGLWYYDGAAWVASGATGDIEGVTAGIGISGGGTSGTVTVTNSMATAIDAKGDLVAGTGADTFARLAVGTNNQVLVADSTEATGLKWATPTAGGWVNLASGSLSSSSVTLSSISQAYSNLRLVISGFKGSVNTTSLRVRLNGDSSTLYRTFTTYGDSGAVAPNFSLFSLAEGQNNTNGNSVIVFNLNNYSSTSTFKSCQWLSLANTDASTTMDMIAAHGAFTSTTAISSLVISPNQGTFSGSYTLYGEN